MEEQAVGEIRSMWDWLMAQLGWGSIQLSWVHILLLVLALIGVLMVLRALLGGRSIGESGVASIYPRGGGLGGLPTSYYVGSKKLSDFSPPPGVYDFKVPTPTPNLSELRKPISVDLDKAGKLFLPAGGQHSDSLKLDSEGEPAEQNPPAGPDLNLSLAKKLFVPKFWGLRK